MKRIAFTALALLAVMASPVLAQATAAKAEAKAEAGWSAELQQHFAGITLTGEQKAKIIASQKTHHAAIDKLNADNKDAAAATKAAVMAHMDAEHADFKAILSADDYKIFQANMGKILSENGMKDMPGMQGMNHDMKDMKGMQGMKGMKMDSAAKKP
jgi:membrane protein involved in colicin uptake